MAEPKVRFKRDDGHSYPRIEPRLLSEFLTVNPDRNKDRTYGKTDVLSVSGDTGVVNQIEFQGRSFAGADVKDYHILYHGDVVYTKSPLKENPFGIVKYNDGPTGIVSTLYAVYHCNDNVYGRIIEYYFDLKSRLNNYLKPLVNIGAKHDMKISAEKAISDYVMLPCLEEQQKIIDFLSSVDDVITASEEEAAHLETLKKAVMKKIFSQEVRFKKPDGSDFSKWEDVKVLDMLVQPITDGPHETPELVEDGVPFVSVEAIENGRVNLNKRRGNITKEYDELCAKKYKPQLYDVYMVKSGATTGKMGIVTIEDDFNIWSPLAAMRTASKTEAFFLFFMLQSDLLQKQVWTKLSLGNQPNLGMRALEEFNAVRPCLEEQRLIVDFLSDFDEAIAAAKKELELWKKLKKGLLQQMFV